MTQPVDAKKIITVKRSDLPACCPPKDQAVWNQHPRVYLPLEKTGRATCPYCGNQFQLEN